MKELSTEQKARRYNEALEKAKAVIEQNPLMEYLKKGIEYIFPELKESEDEKIRKWLIHYFKEVCDNVSEKEKKGIVAWLEKQYEQKSIWHNEDEEPQRDSLILLVMQSGTPIVAKIIEPNHTFNHGERWAYIDDLFEKHGEQKPIQETEPTPIFRIGDVLKRKGKDYTFRVDRIQGGYYHCDRNHGAFFPIEEQNNWELVEQKSAEWSEEDERIYQSIINDIAQESQLDIKQINWLKSLRPQNTWKPSDEQISVLEFVMEDIEKDSIRYAVLNSVLEQLQKLREE